MPAFFLCFKVAEGELLARQMRALVDMENSGMVPMLQQVGDGLRLLLRAGRGPGASGGSSQRVRCRSPCPASVLPSAWQQVACHPRLAAQPCLDVAPPMLQDKYGDLQRMYSLFRRVEGGHELLRKVGTHCHLPQGGGRLPLLPLLPALALLLHA